MTRWTPGLLLLAFLAPARAQEKPVSCLKPEQSAEAARWKIEEKELCAKKPPDLAAAIKEKREKCEAALDGELKPRQPELKQALPEGRDLHEFWNARCAQAQEPAGIAAGLVKPQNPHEKTAEQAAADAKALDAAKGGVAGLADKVGASLGRGDVAELYGERGAGGVGATQALNPGLRETAAAAGGAAQAASAGAYSPLYSGLDKRSADFWQQASAELADDPTGKELLDQFAGRGAALPKIVVKKTDTDNYDMEYMYGQNEMIVGTRYLGKYGLKPGDLDDPAKRAQFIGAVSPLIYHETDHAWADVEFPRKTPRTAASFGREINAYADEMSFIHNKIKKDPNWAESPGARGFMAQYDAYLEDPSAFMDEMAKGAGYKDMPSMQKMRRQMGEELVLEKNRPKRRYPGLEEDIRSMDAEIEKENKVVMPAVNKALNLMRTEKALGDAESLPSPQSLDKLTLARKRLSAFPPEERDGWQKKIDAAGAKESANEVETIKFSVSGGRPGDADQSLRALEDWSKLQGSPIPPEAGAHREEILQAGIKRNLADAERNAANFKKARAADKPMYKQSLLFTLKEAREDASRLGQNIDDQLLAVAKKAGL